MTRRLSISGLLFITTIFAFSPLAFLSYPVVAQAQATTILSCASTYIATLTGWGAHHAALSTAAATPVGAALAAGAVGPGPELTAVGYPVGNTGIGIQLGAITTILAAAQGYTIGDTGVQSVSNTASNQTNNFTNCILRPLAIAMGQRILANITASLVNWIQGGFNGNPAFVTNMDDLLSNSANQAIGEFINSTSLSFLCSPFSLQVRLALATQFYQQQYNGCTLTQIEQNVTNFGNTEAAWQNWLHVSTIPANNQFGAYVQLSAQLNSQLGSQAQQITDQINRSGGFLDYQVCDGGYTAVIPAYTSNGVTVPSYRATVPAGTPGATCKHFHTTTPGKTIEDAVAAKYGSDFNQLGLATDIDQIIGALVNTLVSKALGNSNGLLGAQTQSVNSSADLTSIASQNQSNSDTLNALSNSVAAAQSTQSVGIISGSQTNLATNVTATASTVGVNSSPNNAIDNNLQTTFVSDNELNPSLTINLGSSQSFNEIDIIPPYPALSTLGNIKVEISNSPTFDQGDASTKVWDSVSNTFVPIGSVSTGMFNATSSSTFTVSAPATAQYVRVIKSSDLVMDSVGNCESGNTDSSGACSDPLQISEIEVLQNTQNTNTMTSSETSGTLPVANGTISLSGTPTDSTINIVPGMSALYSLAVSTTGATISPVSATITLTPSGGNTASTDLDQTKYSLMRTVNGQSANIDSGANLISSGKLSLTDLQIPVSFNLSLNSSSAATIGAKYNFTITLTDANGNKLGSNTETFVIQ